LPPSAAIEDAAVSRAASDNLTSPAPVSANHGFPCGSDMFAELADLGTIGELGLDALEESMMELQQPEAVLKREVNTPELVEEVVVHPAAPQADFDMEQILDSWLPANSDSHNSRDPVLPSAQPDPLQMLLIENGGGGGGGEMKMSLDGAAMQWDRLDFPA